MANPNNAFTLHFKKGNCHVYEITFSCNYSYLSLVYTTCNWVNTINE